MVVDFEVDESEPVIILKFFLEGSFMKHPDQQMLFYGETELEDKNYFRTYGMKDGSVVNLKYREAKGRE